MGGESHLRTQAAVVGEVERPVQLVADERADDREPGAVAGVLHAAAVVGDHEDDVAPDLGKSNGDVLAAVLQGVPEHLAEHEHERGRAARRA